MSLGSRQAKAVLHPAENQDSYAKRDFPISSRSPPPKPLIYLERINPARRMHRYEALTVQPHLCGEWSLIRAWGRIGRPSQWKIDLYATEEAALAALARKVQRSAGRGMPSSGLPAFHPHVSVRS